MSNGNTQEELAKTRVHIQVKVEKDGAIEDLELPFVVGVFSDLTGDSDKALPDMANREFTEVTEDNLDQFMSSLEVALDLELDDYLTETGKKEKLRLLLPSLKAFRPEKLVQQGSMQELKKFRDRLETLKAGVAGSAAESELNGVMEELSRVLKRDKKDGSQAS